MGSLTGQAARPYPIRRMTLGFHYPTDVLAGWFLAVSIAMLTRPLAGPGREAGSELVQV